MGATWGRNLRLSIFGESHGHGIGMVVDGLPPGVEVDENAVQKDLERRAPGHDATATSRKEGDLVQWVSGVLNGRTTGAPICGLILNQNTRSDDYENVASVARPAHADYTGFVRYGGFNDVRGGGHFSGRLTAPLVFAGALVRQWLQTLGVTVGAHILSIGVQRERPFDACAVSMEQLQDLYAKRFPVIEAGSEPRMRAEVESARMVQDSVGGVVECAAVGVPPGWGSPFFDSLESCAASLAFSVPAVKGVAFGSGFDLPCMRGSEANDALCMSGGIPVTKTNHNGGVNGGISNGMPVIFRAVIKPTPSIGIKQQSIDYRRMENAEISVRGRHDPCIVPRAVPVIEAVLLLALAECALDVLGCKGGCK